MDDEVKQLRLLLDQALCRERLLNHMACISDGMERAAPGSSRAFLERGERVYWEMLESHAQAAAGRGIDVSLPHVGAYWDAAYEKVAGRRPARLLWLDREIPTEAAG